MASSSAFSPLTSLLLSSFAGDETLLISLASFYIDLGLAVAFSFLISVAAAFFGEEVTTALVSGAGDMAETFLLSSS